MQWNPFNREFYTKSREAVLFLRKVGKDLIDSRAQAMAVGEDVPDDMLTHAIRLSGMMWRQFHEIQP